jgi:hypothetical protein
MNKKKTYMCTAYIVLAEHIYIFRRNVVLHTNRVEPEVTVAHGIFSGISNISPIFRTAIASLEVQK